MSKIDKNEIPIIIDAWKSGIAQTTLALKYHVSVQAIGNLLLYNVPVGVRREVKERNKVLPPKPSVRPTTEDNFWSKADKSNPKGCWPWLANTNAYGYGRFNYYGETMYAHRVAYLMTHGSIPVGKWILHKCNNSNCVNPDHLYAGDPSDNERDARESGVSFHLYKCSPEEIKQIKDLVSYFTLEEIGAMYNIAPITVWKYYKQ